MTADDGRSAPHPGAAPARARTKRFYTAATVEQRGAGYHVLLDGRTVQTPAKRDLALPSRALADAVATEWQAQGTQIEPATMPVTRLVNSALDGVTGREAEVRADIVKFGCNDLVCYMAEAPRELAERQARAWGEIHDWARETLGLRLVLTVGIMPVVQHRNTETQLERLLAPCDALALAGLHCMTTLTGSALLALSVTQDRLSAAEAWRLAHIDEDFQIEQWGEDSEATRRRALRWSEMAAAARVVALAGNR